MTDWEVRDYNPETDEAPEGSEHDCTGEPEEGTTGTDPEETENGS